MQRTRSKRSVSEKNGGSMSGFAKTGKAANRQFTEKTPGQKERGFNQWTESKATAAMQGSAMPSGAVKAPGHGPPRADARRQFTSAPGKKVF